MSTLTQTGAEFNPLRAFKESVPRHPYATDGDYSRGLYRTSKANALECALIQFQHKTKRGLIVLDIDEPLEDIVSPALPLPNILIGNPANGHCHMVFILASPVTFGENSHTKPQRFYEDVSKDLTEAWHGDKSYSGLLCKNPFFPAWVVRVLREAPYTLGELRECLGVKHERPGVPAPAELVEKVSLGRNCAIFENLRFWAYKEVRKYDDEYHFIEACRERANLLNDRGLDSKEVAQIGKNVGAWTWAHKEHFKEKFMAWNKSTNRKSVIARRQKKEDKKEAFGKLYVKGEKTIAEVCKVLGISLRTGKTYAKELKQEREFEDPSQLHLELESEVNKDMKAIFEFTNVEGRRSYSFVQGDRSQLDEHLCSLMRTREARIIPEGRPEFDSVCSAFKRARGEDPVFDTVPVRKPVKPVKKRSRNDWGLSR